ncbi:MAG TPA: response regulator [Polyangia bacterium]
MAPPTILVVDDDPDVLESVAEVLKDAGYDVVPFRNCSLALTHLCQNPAPAAVVVDLLMPGMNAWELFGQMRRRENLAGVPMIAMTGAGPQLGAPVPQHMVLRKPIDGARLLALVQSSTATAAAG